CCRGWAQTRACQSLAFHLVRPNSWRNRRFEQWRVRRAAPRKQNGTCYACCTFQISIFTDAAASQFSPSCPKPSRPSEVGRMPGSRQRYDSTFSTTSLTLEELSRDATSVPAPPSTVSL